ncbi:MAG: hypothetical protein ABUS57_11475 [Pseudomonadota bacterium]
MSADMPYFAPHAQWNPRSRAPRCLLVMPKPLSPVSMSLAQWRCVLIEVGRRRRDAGAARVSGLWRGVRFARQRRGVLLWLYVTAMIFMLGGALNAELEYFNEDEKPAAGGPAAPRAAARKIDPIKA